MKCVRGSSEVTALMKLTWICVQVHPPTFHQPWRSSAAREEEAAALAAAPVAPVHPGDGIVGQDAAHLRAPIAETLPTSSHGPTDAPPEVLAIALVHAVVMNM